MEYRLLGSTGLKVSMMGFGTMGFDDVKRKDTYTELIKKGYECGINFFDTSEAYSSNLSEQLLGASLKKLQIPRENIVISTKIFYGKGFSHPHSNQLINSMGLSRKHIIESTLRSLKSLQTDYIDIAFCHRYDFETPLEETIRAMNWLISHGYIHYWGTCEWTLEQITKVNRLCEKLGLIAPSIEQIHYNFFEREKLELEYMPLLKENKRGVCVWSILGGGILSENSPMRMGGKRNSFFEASPLRKTTKEPEEMEVCFKGLKEIAHELNLTMHEFAIAWGLKHPDITCAVMGWRKIVEIEESLHAITKIPLITQSVEEKVKAVFNNWPEGENDWLKYKPIFKDKRNF